jgi:hypothetical protein
MKYNDLELTETQLYKDLGYVVLYGVERHYITFMVFEILSLEPKILLHAKHEDSRPNPVETFEDAEVFLAGRIKWDGCADLNWAPDDDGYHHYCSRKQATEIGTLLHRIYELASDAMPNYEDLDGSPILPM